MEIRSDAELLGTVIIEFNEKRFDEFFLVLLNTAFYNRNENKIDQSVERVSSPINKECNPYILKILSGQFDDKGILTDYDDLVKFFKLLDSNNLYHYYFGTERDNWSFESGDAILISKNKLDKNGLAILNEAFLRLSNKKKPELTLNTFVFISSTHDQETLAQDFFDIKTGISGMSEAVIDLIEADKQVEEVTEDVEFAKSKLERVIAHKEYCLRKLSDEERLLYEIYKEDYKNQIYK